MKNKIKETMINPVKEENTSMKTNINLYVSEDDIRKRAYEICIERGNLYAPPEADWIKAEAELRNTSYKKKREKRL